LVCSIRLNWENPPSKLAQKNPKKTPCRITSEVKSPTAAGKPKTPASNAALANRAAGGGSVDWLVIWPHFPVTFPNMFAVGSAPQKRLSYAFVELSPRTKHEPPGTTYGKTTARGLLEAPGMSATYLTFAIPDGGCCRWVPTTILPLTIDMVSRGSPTTRDTLVKPVNGCRNTTTSHLLGVPELNADGSTMMTSPGLIVGAIDELGTVYSLPHPARKPISVSTHRTGRTPAI
jgi:hypothetical protein